jgi:hypothetical protein
MNESSENNRLMFSLLRRNFRKHPMIFILNILIQPQLIIHVK